MSATDRSTLMTYADAVRVADEGNATAEDGRFHSVRIVSSKPRLYRVDVYDSTGDYTGSL